MALFTQQAALIAQQVPLIDAIEPLNFQAKTLIYLTKQPTSCSTHRLFSVNDGECIQQRKCNLNDWQLAIYYVM